MNRRAIGLAALCLVSFPIMAMAQTDEIQTKAHGQTGPPFQTDDPTSVDLIDAGGDYHFKQPGLQLLFAYGHSVEGQTENYGYLGLYKTWGKDKGAPEVPSAGAMHNAR